MTIGEGTSPRATISRPPRATRHRPAQAIRDYQEKLGLAVDGRVSEALLGHLEKVTGAGG